MPRPLLRASPAACFASHAGVFVDDGVFAKSRASALAAAVTTPCSTASATGSDSWSTTSVIDRSVSGLGELVTLNE